jgi:hypothetical protein
MSLSLNCPHCSRRLGIKDPTSGKPVKCPRCAGLVHIPNVAPANGWWQDHQEAPRREYGAPLKVVKPRWYGRPDGRLLGAGVAVALVLAAGVGGAVWMVQPEPQPVAIAQPETPVEVALAEVGVRPIEEPLPTPPVEVSVRLAPLAEELPVPEPVAVLPPKPEDEPYRFLAKRRQFQSAEDLRKQLLHMAELTLEGPTGKARPNNTVGGGPVGNQLLSQGGTSKLGQLVHFTPTFLGQRPDLHGLPFQMGVDCQLGKEPAEAMQALSRQMRGIMAEATKNERGDTRMDPDVIGTKINSIYAKIDFHKETAVPCLMQMLQPESTGVRKVLVDQLNGIKKPKATEGLVKLALFDLSDSIREEAIKALARRPREEFRQQLLAGLRYPWPAVADHAAEALVALNDTPSVPVLRELAKQPDPSEASYDNNQKAWMVPEVVRINHLGNCLMCHAPSKVATDNVRGRIPSQNQPLPPLTQYYEDTTGPFVRADITYLRQDFSVIQPVDRPGPWPAMQRFDYLVRTRYETVQEFYARQNKGEKTTYPQREAVLFALKELSK